jgi:hypothetical protein
MPSGQIPSVAAALTGGGAEGAEVGMAPYGEQAKVRSATVTARARSTATV